MIGTVVVFALAGLLWLAGVYCAVGFALSAQPAKEDEWCYATM